MYKHCFLSWLLVFLMKRCCCNLSVGVALNVWFTTNGMCAKNNIIYTWREQAIIEWSRRVNSIVACCHNAKLCAHAAWDFWSQQSGAVTRMWRSCCVKPWQREHAISAVRCKKEGMLLQPRNVKMHCSLPHNPYCCLLPSPVYLLHPVIPLGSITLTWNFSGCHIKCQASTLKDIKLLSKLAL